MMKKTLLSVILLLAIVFTAHTQQHCFFTHYSTEDGLSQNTVMSILQDHKDNLWFATWDGINRFNGYTFKTYKARQGNYISLTNNRADRMYEDRYGFLWLLTYDNRVHRFDPKTETFEQVPAAGEEGSAFNVHTIEVMPNGTVWLLTENDGAIRILTHPDENHRLTWDIYSNKTELFPSLHVFKVHQDKAGNDWLLTDNGLGMIRPGDKEPVSYFTETKGKLSGMNQAFYAVQERDEDICFASDHGGGTGNAAGNGSLQEGSNIAAGNGDAASNLIQTLFSFFGVAGDMIYKNLIGPMYNGMYVSFILILIITAFSVGLLFKIFVGNLFEVGGCRFYEENSEHKTRIALIVDGFLNGAYLRNVATIFCRDLYTVLIPSFYIG